MKYLKLSLALISASLFIQSCTGTKEIVKQDTPPAETVVEKKVEPTVSLPRIIIGEKSVDEAFPCVSGDGSKLVYQRKIMGGNWEIWLYDFGKESTEAFYKSAGNCENPVYSPDGSKIVFTDDLDGSSNQGNAKNRDLYLMDNDGHNVKKLTDSKSDNWHPVFSADGSKIYFASNRNDSEQKYYDEVSSVFSYEISTGKIEEIMPLGQYKNNPAISSKDNMFAFTNKDNKLEIQNLETQSGGRIVSDAESQSGGAFFHADGDRLFYHNLKSNVYEIRCYFQSGDYSSAIISNLVNARSPFVKDNDLFFHSNQEGDFDIYKKVLP